MHKKRVAVGLLVAAAFAAIMAFLTGPIQFVLLLLFAIACQAELYALAARGGYRVYNKLGCGLGVLWFFLVYLDGGASPECSKTLDLFDVIVPLAIGFAVLMRALFDVKAKKAFETTSITLFGIFYGPFLLSYFLRLAQYDATVPWATTRAGVFLTFFLALIIKLSDTGAFAAGTLCGRHYLFPRISPKKTWEGLAGGLVAGIASGLLTAYLAQRFQWGPEGIFYSAAGTKPLLTLPVVAVLSAVFVIVGLFGDLIESMFKRSVQTKDSSGTLPGLGGLLDIADSIVFAPGLFYFLLLAMR